MWLVIENVAHAADGLSHMLATDVFLTVEHF